MTTRIEHLKAAVSRMNDAGVRRTHFYTLVHQSLAETHHQPVQLRRAIAIAYLLDKAPVDVVDGQLLAGTMSALCPPAEDAPSYEACRSRAVEILEEYLAARCDGEAAQGFDRNRLKTFEAEFTGKKSRWALMSRVHHDACLPYADFQRLLAEMEALYLGRDGLERYEIGRELERGLVFENQKVLKSKLDQLPWFAANHLALQYKTALEKGLGGLHRRIRKALSAPVSRERREFYKAADITCAAVVRFIERHAQMLSQKAATAVGPTRKSELLEMSEICRRIATRPAKTLREGVQLLWLLHIAAAYAGSSAMSLGRLDQYLLPLYRRDMGNGASREECKELLSCLWLGINEPMMRTVQSITLGGTAPNGEDAANELTRLCLEVTRELGLPYPNVGLRLSEGESPDWLYDLAVQGVCAGGGQPMLMNDAVFVPALEALGYPAELARDYYNMGCVEIMIPGKQPNWGVTDPIAFPMLLESLFRRAGRGELTCEVFDEFFETYKRELRAAISADCEEAQKKQAAIQGRCYDPLASLLIDGCLERGLDMFQGGSELGAHWSVYAYGLGTAADSLAAVKRLVFEEKRLPLTQFGELLETDFSGHEALRAELACKTPHYGNDDDTVDELAAEVFACCTEAVYTLNRPGSRDKLVSTFFGYFFHIYHGEITGASPNGRRRGEPFSDSMGPSQGKDVNGPTRLLNSVVKLNHSRVTGGYALNMKLSPALTKDTAGRGAVKTLLRSFFQRGGPQVQFYAVDADALRQARLEPEKHRDLIVRVGGYCEYFVNLDASLQEEIIHRTAHGD